MKFDKHDYAGSVVAVNAMARELQKQAASPTNIKAVYRIATDIMIECQRIRESTQQEASPKTIGDYIKNLLGDTFK